MHNDYPSHTVVEITGHRGMRALAAGDPAPEICGTLNRKYWVFKPPTLEGRFVV